MFNYTHGIRATLARDTNIGSLQRIIISELFEIMGLGFTALANDQDSIVGCEFRYAPFEITLSFSFAFMKQVIRTHANQPMSISNSEQKAMRRIVLPNKTFPDSLDPYAG